MKSGGKWEKVDDKTKKWWMVYSLSICGICAVEIHFSIVKVFSFVKKQVTFGFKAQDTEAKILGRAGDSDVYGAI